MLFGLLSQLPVELVNLLAQRTNDLNIGSDRLKTCSKDRCIFHRHSGSPYLLDAIFGHAVLLREFRQRRTLGFLQLLQARPLAQKLAAPNAGQVFEPFRHLRETASICPATGVHN